MIINALKLSSNVYLCFYVSRIGGDSREMEFSFDESGVPELDQKKVVLKWRATYMNSTRLDDSLALAEIEISAGPQRLEDRTICFNSHLRPVECFTGHASFMHVCMFHNEYGYSSSIRFAVMFRCQFFSLITGVLHSLLCVDNEEREVDVSTTPLAVEFPNFNCRASDAANEDAVKKTKFIRGRKTCYGEFGHSLPCSHPASIYARVFLRVIDHAKTFLFKAVKFYNLISGEELVPYKECFDVQGLLATCTAPNLGFVHQCIFLGSDKKEVFTAVDAVRYYCYSTAIGLSHLPKGCLGICHGRDALFGHHLPCGLRPVKIAWFLPAYHNGFAEDLYIDFLGRPVAHPHSNKAVLRSSRVTLLPNDPRHLLLVDASAQAHVEERWITFHLFSPRKYDTTMIRLGPLGRPIDQSQQMKAFLYCTPCHSGIPVADRPLYTCELLSPQHTQLTVSCVDIFGKDVNCLSPRVIERRSPAFN